MDLLEDLRAENLKDDEPCSPSVMSAAGRLFAPFWFKEKLLFEDMKNQSLKAKGQYSAGE